MVQRLREETDKEEKPSCKENRGSSQTKRRDKQSLGRAEVRILSTVRSQT